MFMEKTMAIATKKIEIVLIAVFFALSVFALSVDNASAGLDCPSGFGDCDCDGTCETDVFNDPNNCGSCGVVCESEECVMGYCNAMVPVLGGLVPCGREFDDELTSWSEKEDCTICHLVILTDNVIDYLLGLVGVVVVLSMIIGGLLYITSAGNSSLISTAKTAFYKSLYGFVVVLVVWVAVNTTMVLFGFDDPLGDGSWHKFDCDLEGAAPPLVNFYCGDGLVTDPNDEGIAEVCDPKETLATYQGRVPGGSAAKWVETIYACDPTTCTLGCAGDSNIGKGCYQPELASGGTGSTCQKGVYVCDYSLSPPAAVCKNTYNDPAYKLAGKYCEDVYDYCCSFKEGEITLDNARTNISSLGPTRIKHPEAWTDSGVNPAFHCDDVCKNAGQVCVGVGLTDSVLLDACLGVTCHSGSDCTGNTGNIDCRLSFPFVRAGEHNECTLCNNVACTYGGVNSLYYVGYSSCLCF